MLLICRNAEDVFRKVLDVDYYRTKGRARKPWMHWAKKDTSENEYKLRSRLSIIRSEFVEVPDKLWYRVAEIWKDQCSFMIHQPAM